MRRRKGKIVFEVKFELEDEIFFKVYRFLEKRNLKKTKFIRTAMFNEIKRVLKEESIQNGSTINNKSN